MKKNNLILVLLVTALVCFLGSCDGDTSTVHKGDMTPYDPNKPVVVTNIGPKKGGLGTRVVVSGSNFGNDKSKVKVFFNQKEALVLNVNSNNIYAMVPKQPGEESVITVKIQKGTDNDGNPVYVEQALEDQTFAYKIRAAVTTVAGVYNVNDKAVDGTALATVFRRPVMCDVDDEGNLMIVDDRQAGVRFFSSADNMVKTVLAGMHEPWQGSYNADYTEYYVIERRSSQRPLVAYKLSKVSNWTEAEPIYGQSDDNGNSILSTLDYYGLTADDQYIYLLSEYGYRFVRINQKTMKMELMAKDLGLADWSHIAFNPKDRMIYATAEGWGKIYRFDPYKENLTVADVEHVVGMGKGSPIEGNGLDARMSNIEGLCADLDGNLYVSDYGNHIIWKVDSDMNATIFAGLKDSKSGYKDGKPEEAQFNTPYDVAVDPNGLVYVADVYNYVVRCIAVQ